MMKTATLLGRSAAEAQVKKADLNKLSGVMEPGKIICTLDGSHYRVASKTATADGYTFRLADLQGKPVQTPADFHPVTAALARTAAWMRFVFAYNADFDLYVKEYIKEAGLPIDPKMNWAKWFQYTYPPKLSGITKDPDVVDEAIHQVIITALAKRKDLTKFDPKRLPAGAQAQPLAEQVTTYLQWLFKKRVSEAYEFIKEKLQPSQEVSMYQPADEQSEGETEHNLLDTEEHATPGGQGGVEEATDLQRLRDQFAAWLAEEETPNEIKKLLVLYDVFTANVGRKLKISDYEADWKANTGLGFDSLKPVYAKFQGYIPEFLVSAGLISADKAKARGMAQRSSLASLTLAGTEEIPGAGTYTGDNEEIITSALETGPTSDEQIIPNQTAEAGPATEELNENSHAENGPQGSPVLDGKLKHPERPNVDAMREALDTQVEMEVGKPIEQKQEELESGDASKAIEVGGGKEKATIVININAAGSNCTCGHHKTYHDLKNKMCHGGTKENPCNCDGRFKKEKTSSFDAEAGFAVLQSQVKNTQKILRAAGIAAQFEKDEDSEGAADPEWLVGFRTMADFDRALKVLKKSGIAVQASGDQDAVDRTGDKEEMFNPKAAVQVNYYVQIMRPQASIPGLDKGMVLALGYTNAGEGYGGAQQLQWWKEMPELRYKQIVQQIKKTPGLVDRQRAESLYHAIQNTGNIMEAEGATTDQVLEYFKDCPECGHPMDRHKAPYGCEYERGDREGGEGPNGPEPAQAMGPCGCKHGLEPKTGSKTGSFWINRFLPEGKSQFGGRPSAAEPARRILREAGIPSKVVTQRESSYAYVQVAMEHQEQAKQLLQSKGIKVASGYGDTGAFPHNPEGGDGHTGPSQPIVVDDARVLKDPSWMDDKEKNVVAAPAPVMQAPRKPVQGPQQKSYGTPVGEKKDTDVIDPNDPNAQQDQDSGSGYEQQPRRKTIMPELPNAEMIMQLNSSDHKAAKVVDFDVVLPEDQGETLLQAASKNPAPFIVTYAGMDVHTDIGLKFFNNRRQADAWARKFNTMQELDPDEGAMAVPREEAIDWLRGLVGPVGLQHEGSTKAEDAWEKSQERMRNHIRHRNLRPGQRRFMPEPIRNVIEPGKDDKKPEEKDTAKPKKASHVDEVMEEFVDTVMGEEVKWVSGHDKGMTFVPQSFEAGNDPHFRGSYENHPEFGSIPDDMHQAWSLIEDLVNGTAVCLNPNVKGMAAEVEDALNDDAEQDEDYDYEGEDDEEVVEASVKTAEPGAAPAPAPDADNEQGEKAMLDQDYEPVGPFRGNLVKYDQEDFVALVNSKYGWAVSGQAESLLDGGDPEDQNSNALRYIMEFAQRKGETELAEYLQNYLNTIGYKMAAELPITSSKLASFHTFFRS